MRQCLSSVETQKSWLDGLCVAVRAGEQEKSTQKSQGKGKQDVWGSKLQVFSPLLCKFARIGI